MQLALHAPGDFAPANDNVRARIEYDVDGSIVRVIPAKTTNPLRCGPHIVTKPAQPMQQAAAALRTRISARQAIGDGWDGRRVLSWPTAERLLRQERHDDLRRLYEWRALVDLATLEPANDNIANPAPAEGEDDDRAPEEVIDQADSLMVFRPSVGDIKAATKWSTEDRAAVLEQDRKSGALRKAVGGLVFDGENRLVSFQREPDGRVHMAKPEVLYRHRSERVPMPHAVSSFGIWSVQSHIEAREQLRIWSSKLGTDHCAVLELACGPNTAKAIGEMLGKTGKTAERVGIGATDNALAALASLKRD